VGVWRERCAVQNEQRVKLKGLKQKLRGVGLSGPPARASGGGGASVWVCAAASAVDADVWVLGQWCAVQNEQRALEGLKAEQGGRAPGFKAPLAHHTPTHLLLCHS
jgi:hypothetical protein